MTRAELARLRRKVHAQERANHGSLWHLRRHRLSRRLARTLGLTLRDCYDYAGQTREWRASSQDGSEIRIGPIYDLNRLEEWIEART